MSSITATPVSESRTTGLLEDKLAAKTFFLASVSFFSIPFVYHAFKIGADFAWDGVAEYSTFETQNPRIALYLIAWHMMLGASMNFLAPLQVYLGLTNPGSKLHLYLGRVVLAIALFGATVGSLYFSMYKDVNWGLQGHAVFHVYQAGSMYGIVMLYVLYKCVQTLFQKSYVAHKEWAIRLFILAIGSWINRVTTGWIVVFFISSALVGVNEPINPEVFTYINPWTFYIVPLLVYEVYVRLKRSGATQNLPRYAPGLTALCGVMILGVGTCGYLAQMYMK